MNYAICFYIIGWVLRIEAGLMLPSFITGLICREAAAWPILWSALIGLAASFPLTFKKPTARVFYVREAMVTVALSWLALSVFGSLPFMLSGAITHPVDALFETVSGFTTTGASILPDVEGLPRCILFWRSFTHWIGGMGVLVFLLSLLPLAGGTPMNIMKAESPGPSVSRLVPKVRSTAKVLYQIYLGMTVLMVILLLLARMPVFDSLVLTFGTAGTGGFGIRNDSIASYTVLQQGIITVFMILFGVNFNLYFLLLTKNVRQAFKSEEVRAYLGIIAASVLVITLNTLKLSPTAFEAFHHAAFQVGSVITTTGYSTRDFSAWPELSRTILLLLMICGACAGSTGGGMKVSRLLILLKNIRLEFQAMLHPHAVRKVHMDGKPLEREVVHSTNTFLAVYVLIFAVSFLLISIQGLGTSTNLSAVAATLNNIGPGLDLVGPAANYSVYTAPAKCVLIFDMLAGRLELFPLLVLFLPRTWKKF